MPVTFLCRGLCQKIGFGRKATSQLQLFERRGQVVLTVV